MKRRLFVLGANNSQVAFPRPPQGIDQFAPASTGDTLLYGGRTSFGSSGAATGEGQRTKLNSKRRKSRSPGETVFSEASESNLYARQDSNL